MIGYDVIVTHSEENIGTSEMGMLAAVPAASKGTLTDKDARWMVRGVQAGYASPVSDGERIYLLDNGGVLFAFDAKTGKQLWTEKLGTIAKASPVLADGKLYIGTENTGMPEASSTSSGRTRTRPRSSTRTGWERRRNPNKSSRRRSSRAAASTSSRWTRCMRSDRRAPSGAAANPTTGATKPRVSLASRQRHRRRARLCRASARPRTRGRHLRTNRVERIHATT